MSVDIDGGVEASATGPLASVSEVVGEAVLHFDDDNEEMTNPAIGDGGHEINRFPGPPVVLAPMIHTTETKVVTHAGGAKTKTTVHQVFDSVTGEVQGGAVSVSRTPGADAATVGDEIDHADKSMGGSGDAGKQSMEDAFSRLPLPVAAHDEYHCSGIVVAIWSLLIASFLIVAVVLYCVVTKVIEALYGDKDRSRSRSRRTDEWTADQYDITVENCEDSGIKGDEVIDEMEEKDETLNNAVEAEERTSETTEPKSSTKVDANDETHMDVKGARTSGTRGSTRSKTRASGYKTGSISFGQAEERFGSVVFGGSDDVLYKGE
ncbi:unnamed protein product [Amoebophrya sp. A25]|nr:unnamed protein product [Amoebophrya sp. A25]|eukprot:GSA25T00001554001.1